MSRVNEIYTFTVKTILSIHLHPSADEKIKILSLSHHLLQKT